MTSGFSLQPQGCSFWPISRSPQVTHWWCPQTNILPAPLSLKVVSGPRCLIISGLRGGGRGHCVPCQGLQLRVSRGGQSLPPMLQKCPGESECKLGHGLRDLKVPAPGGNSQPAMAFLAWHMIYYRISGPSSIDCLASVHGFP